MSTIRPIQSVLVLLSGPRSGSVFVQTVKNPLSPLVRNSIALIGLDISGEAVARSKIYRRHWLLFDQYAADLGVDS